MSRPGESHKTLYILLGAGVLFLLGSVPMFILKTPIIVFHQAYKAVPSQAEMITPESGAFYGFVFAGMGILMIWIFLRVKKSLREDEGRRRR